MCEQCVSRRQMLVGAGAATLASAVGLGGGAEARPVLRMTTLCAYAGAPRISRLAPATRRAVDEVSQIQRAIGYAQPLHVFRGDAGNALASIVSDGSGRRRRVIVYRPEFMESLYRRGGPGAPLTVLAHEVGHHANGDFSYRAQHKHPWRKELGADYIAGLALARLGYRSADATRALMMLYRRYGSRTHPDTPRRVEAMRAGWRDGGGRDRLRFG
ncbi:MAG: hypothetical protein AAFW46_09585 [Pseudomonadota bacterium]